MGTSLFLLLLSFVGIMGRLQLGDLGDPCGRDNEGQITLIDDCSMGVTIPYVMEANDDWTRNNKVCCRQPHYQRDKKSVRKSEEACSKFGPGIKRNVFPSTYVQPGEYQHNVALGYEEEPNKDEIVWGACNGALISENYVLTVAHCMRRRDGYIKFVYGMQNLVYRQPKMVRLGNIDLTGEEDAVKPQDLPISAIIIHPDYNKRKSLNDIALLRLGEPAVFTKYVQPACLYTKPDTPDILIETGWGKIQADASVSDILLKTNIKTKDADTCTKFYQGRIRYDQEAHLCGTTDTGVCYLLSGSTAFIENSEGSRVTIVGLGAYGGGCSSSVPEILIRVSAYLNWIETIVWG